MNKPLPSTIWKYPLATADRQVVPVPEGARFLHLGVQGHVPTMWLLVDPEAPREDWVVRILGTGWEPVDTGSLGHLGTVQMGNGLVWHLFREWACAGAAS